MSISGVKTATKTGTTDDGKDAKDSWMMSYSPRMATGVWVGRHDGRAVRFASNRGTGGLINEIMGKAHRDVFANDGSWREGDWFTRPGGVQDVTVNGKKDIYPSWYVKPANANGEKMAFDSVSKKKATSCTPDRAKVELDVQVFEDPITKKKTSSAPDGYDANADDNVHKCDDVKPFVSIDVDNSSGNEYEITASVTQGTHALKSLEFIIDGQVVSSQSISSTGDYAIDVELDPGSHTIGVKVIDQALYEASDEDPPIVVSSKPSGRGSSSFFGRFGR